MVSGASSSSGKINIAIDGPAGAGKSTIARRVAGMLSYIYVDTGAMYRAATWYFQQLGIEPEDEEKVLQTVPNLVIELIPGEDGQRVSVNGQEATEEIRSLAVNAQVSRYAQIEGLRGRLVSLQRQMALRKGVVMDGRDIGTTVLPDAEVKVFMTASVEERARRRYKEMKERDQITLDQLIRDIDERDRLDREREISPLRQAEDAVLLDTTNMTPDEVAEAIVSMCRTYVRKRETE
ncbi:(d)CMP kinase [Paenibacillus sp. alder61]|uniref:Cytidylate kinase n=2 Tax=Paenibacillus faecis TaxID=862114 RepID=A0A5D0CTJ6_9BACL|nr:MULTISPECIES: (d)CMP kinase [Paenibacillus]MCA1294716.1 (d)CMP kinase [Paenibacillus sp. alder61]TYA13291.1 (d)CMP kinase [Paenibacillus faecis]